jgi:predicted DNA-binding WGR domain protein
MSDWTVQLEFAEGTSSKFWRARTEGKTLYVNYGKIGTTGQTQVKDLADPAAARAEYEKLIREKRKKGYDDAGQAADAAGPTDDAADEDDEADDEDERPAKKPAKPAPAAKPAAAPSAAPTKPAAAPAPAASRPADHRLVLDAGSRKVETALYLDGETVRMDSTETYASPEAAQKALERLKKMLAAEGHKPT